MGEATSGINNRMGVMMQTTRSHVLILSYTGTATTTTFLFLDLA